MATSTVEFGPFALGAADRLLRLSYLLTGRRAAALELTADALLLTRQRWDAASMSAADAIALQSLLNCYRGRFRRNTDELHVALIDAVADPDAERGETGTDCALWGALAELAEDERAVLVLRYAEELTDTQIGAVLGWPVLRVTFIARRALRTLTTQVSDIEVEAALPVALSAAADDFGRSVEPDPFTKVVDRADMVTRASRAFAAGARLQPVRAPVGWRSALAAAAAVVVAVVVWQLPDRLSGGDPGGGAAPTASRNRPAVLQPPPGGKFVGYGDVMLTVPAGWSQTSGCLTGDNGAVSYENTPPDVSCAGEAPRALVSFRSSIVGPPQLLGRSVAAGAIAGKQLLLTPVRRVGPSYQQIVAVPADRFYVVVQARERRVVARVVASLREVPAGFRVVPSVQSLRAPHARAALREVGLRLTKRAVAIGSWPHQAPRVGSQSPAVGSVVPAGSAVSVVAY